MHLQYVMNESLILVHPPVRFHVWGKSFPSYTTVNFVVMCLVCNDTEASSLVKVLEKHGLSLSTQYHPSRDSSPISFGEAFAPFFAGLPVGPLATVGVFLEERPDVLNHCLGAQYPSVLQRLSLSATRHIDGTPSLAWVAAMAHTLEREIVVFVGSSFLKGLCESAQAISITMEVIEHDNSPIHVAVTEGVIFHLLNEPAGEQRFHQVNLVVPCFPPPPPPNYQVVVEMPPPGDFLLEANEEELSNRRRTTGIYDTIEDPDIDPMPQDVDDVPVVEISPMESLHEALTDTQSLTMDALNQFDVHAHFYNPSKKLCFDSTTAETLARIGNLCINDVERIESLDIDGVFGLLETDRLTRLIQRSTLEVVKKTVDRTKVERPGFRRMMQLPTDECVAGWTILEFGEILQPFKGKCSVFFCVKDPPHGVSTLVDEVIHETVGFECGLENHLRNHSHSQLAVSMFTSNQPRDANVTRRNPQVRHTIGKDLLPCFEYCLNRILRVKFGDSVEALFYIRWVGMKNVFCAVMGVEGLGKIVPLIRSVINFEAFKVEFFDVCRQVTPLRPGISFMLKRDCDPNILLIGRRGLYGLFMTRAIGNTHCYSLGPIAKENVYSNIIDAISHGRVMPFKDDNSLFQLLESYVKREDVQRQALLAQQLEKIAQDADILKEAVASAFESSHGIRLEYRVRYADLANMVSVMPQLLVNESVYVVETKDMLFWIRALYAALTKPMRSALMLIASMPSLGADLTVFKSLFCTISILKSLVTRTLLNGQQLSYGAQLVWNRTGPTLDMGRMLALYNRPSFAFGDVWSLALNRLIVDDRTNAKVEILISKICSSSRNRVPGPLSPMKSIMAIAEIGATVNDPDAAARFVWMEYKQSIKIAAGITSNEPLLVRVLVDARVHIPERTVDARPHMAIVFQTDRLTHRQWGQPFLYAYQKAEAMYGRQVMLDSLERIAPRCSVQAIHQAFLPDQRVTARRGNANSRQVSSFMTPNRSFWRLDFANDPYVPIDTNAAGAREDARRLRQEIAPPPRLPGQRTYLRWMPQHSQLLVDAVNDHGGTFWSQILGDTNYPFGVLGFNAYKLSDKWQEWTRKAWVETNERGEWELIHVDTGRRQRTRPLARAIVQNPRHHPRPAVIVPPPQRTLIIVTEGESDPLEDLVLRPPPRQRPRVNRQPRERAASPSRAVNDIVSLISDEDEDENDEWAAFNIDDLVTFNVTRTIELEGSDMEEMFDATSGDDDNPFLTHDQPSIVTESREDLVEDLAVMVESNLNVEPPSSRPVVRIFLSAPTLPAVEEQILQETDSVVSTNSVMTIPTIPFRTVISHCSITDEATIDTLLVFEKLNGRFTWSELYKKLGRHPAVNRETWNALKTALYNEGYLVDASTKGNFKWYRAL